MSDTKKVYVNEKDKVTIICPQCGTVRVDNASQYKSEIGSSNVEMTCGKCENNFTVFIDFRRYYRKKTSLTGICRKVEDESCFSKVTIENISRNGVGFTTPADFPVELGEAIEVQFNLDDDDRTFIRKRVTIRYVRGNYMGAEFDDLRKFGTEIGFYLKRSM